MIIGISGKIGSGKDLTGQIIQALVNKPDVFDGMEVVTAAEIEYKVWDKPKFENKKFADTLKDMICVLLSCTREQLEDRDFKESSLPENWWYWKSYHDGTMFAYTEQNMDIKYWELIKTTPRLLLQLMGTECGRDILHPNVWVNAVMSQYKPYLEIYHEGKSYYPDWIMTDMRFPNELEAVKERHGITIRVNRPEYENQGKEFYAVEEEKHVWFDNRQLGCVSFVDFNQTKDHSLFLHREMVTSDKHPSEVSLDYAKFDYTIVNNGTIKDLVNKIKEILILEKII